MNENNVLLYALMPSGGSSHKLIWPTFPLFERRRGRFPLWLFIPLFLFPTSARGAEPWDVPFNGNPELILEAARRVPVPEEYGVVMLLEQHQYTIDDAGRTRSSVRRVYWMMSQDAVQDWSSVEQEYAPWYERRPELRARVIRADGSVHWLDPKTIADAPAQEFDPSIYSDRRVVRAPLPAVAAGAVVEYEITTQEIAPLLDAGVVRRAVIYTAAPLQRFMLTLEAGRKVRLRTAAKGIPKEAIRQEMVRNATRIVVDVAPVDHQEDVQWNLPPETAAYPYFAFSTGDSWQVVASRYAEIVDQKIKGAILNPLLEGIERAAGLDAYVALLNAGFSTDADPDLPGLGFFNHAIVYVAGDSPLWVDATATETRVGDLPLSAQGRLALVAARGTTALERTPESTAADNLRVHTIEIRMSSYGPGEIHETVEVRGSLESDMRRLYDGGGEKRTRETLERYVKSDLLAGSLGEFSVPNKEDFSEPFRLSVQALGARRSLTFSDEAVVAFFPHLVFQELPYVLTADFDEDDAPPRRNDFFFFEPHRVEYRYRIVVPPEGNILAVFRFDTGKRRLTPNEFTALRQGLKEHYKNDAETISFVTEASEFMALGQTKKALDVVRRILARDPQEPGAQVRLSRMLIAAGANNRPSLWPRESWKRTQSSVPAGRRSAGLTSTTVSAVALKVTGTEPRPCAATGKPSA